MCIKKKDVGHRPQILNDEQKEKICDWIDENCQLTLKQTVQKCYEEWNLKLSPSTVDRALRDFHYTVKQITLIPEKRNTIEVISKRYDYAIEYNQMMAEKEKMYFIDETGIQIWTRANYGRSAKGTPATKIVKRIRSTNYSIASAMNNESLYFFEIQNKPYNSEDYSDFLNKLIENFLLDNINEAYLIMDNVRFHKTHLVKNLIESHGHYAIFLPPYSPFLNPIENLFNQWKNIVKRGEPNNEDALYELVNTASEKITPENCANYFKNMEKYIFRLK